jgi:rhodanese-related sulfurtransferase
MLNLFKSNQLNQNQAHEQLSNDPSIKLLDVRTKAEY